MDHDQEVRKILAGRTSSGTIRSRESNTVEFKQSFNKGNTAAYAKTMAAYANNSGGYIIFGITDSPSKIVGLKNDNLRDDMVGCPALTISFEDLYLQDMKLSSEIIPSLVADPPTRW